MRLRRSTILVAIMLAMLGARLCVPLASSERDIVSPSRQVSPPYARASAAGPGETPAVREPVGSDASMAEEQASGDPFAVRPPPSAPAPSLHPAPSAAPPPAPAVVAAAPPPADPPPAFQVIGAWNDGANAGVFVASPTGVELARAGARLGAEYKVAAISRTSLDLEHIGTGRHVVLPIPAAAAAP